jgi:hypothetical protein
VGKQKIWSGEKQFKMGKTNLKWKSNLKRTVNEGKRQIGFYSFFLNANGQQ